jgi:hypothetical protein
VVVVVVVIAAAVVVEIVVVVVVVGIGVPMDLTILKTQWMLFERHLIWCIYCGLPGDLLPVTEEERKTLLPYYLTLSAKCIQWHHFLRFRFLLFCIKGSRAAFFVVLNNIQYI